MRRNGDEPDISAIAGGLAVRLPVYDKTCVIAPHLPGEDFVRSMGLWVLRPTGVE